MSEINTLIAQIIPLLIALFFAVLGSIITVKVLPYIADQRQYKRIRQFVQAAEKLANAGKLPKDEKNEYVLQLMEDAGIPVNQITKALVESAVLELDNLNSGKEKYILQILEKVGIPITDGTKSIVQSVIAGVDKLVKSAVKWIIEHPAESEKIEESVSEKT